MATYRLVGLFLFSIIVAVECSYVDILQRIKKVEELQLGYALKNNVLEEKLKLLEENNYVLENELKAYRLKDQNMEASIKVNSL